MVKIFIFTNPNPEDKRVTDCTIRAITIAEDSDWDTVAAHTFSKAHAMKEMPDSNKVWSAYLSELGYKRHTLPDTCPECYTVADFAADHPDGTYIVCCDGHVVTVKDGAIMDTFDSGDYTAIYYWIKEDKRDA